MAILTGDRGTTEIDPVQVKAEAGITFVVKFCPIYPGWDPGHRIMAGSTIFAEHPDMFRGLCMAGSTISR